MVFLTVYCYREYHVQGTWYFMRNPCQWLRCPIKCFLCKCVLLHLKNGKCVCTSAGFQRRTGVACQRTECFLCVRCRQPCGRFCGEVPAGAWEALLSVQFTVMLSACPTWNRKVKGRRSWGGDREREVGLQGLQRLVQESRQAVIFVSVCTSTHIKRLLCFPSS